jgi:hypothetical protein
MCILGISVDELQPCGGAPTNIMIDIAVPQRY